RPLMRQSGQCDVASIRAAEHPGRTAIRMLRSGAPRRVAFPERHTRHSHLVHMKVSIQKGGLDVLSTPRFFTVQESEADGHGGRHAGRYVPDGHRDQRGSLLWVAYQISDARIGLGIEIV